MLYPTDFKNNTNAEILFFFPGVMTDKATNRAGKSNLCETERTQFIKDLNNLGFLKINTTIRKAKSNFATVRLSFILWLGHNHGTCQDWPL